MKAKAYIVHRAMCEPKLEWSKPKDCLSAEPLYTPSQPAQVDPCVDGSCSCCWKHLDEQPAQQQQEPVARVEETWASENGHEIPGMTERYAEFFNEPPPKGTLLYTSPPASKPWVGLTDDEMNECWGDPLTPLGMKHARAIEAKLREKNT